MKTSRGMVLGATLGWAGGLGVVSSCAYALNRLTPAPPFTPKGSRFSNAHFQGRFSNMVSQMDPATLFASQQEIRRAEELVRQAASGPVKGVDDATLWKAKLLCDSAIHPDTKEIVPRPFRMAGYVPFNGPVCVAMMVVTSTPALLMWNWVNQSQNALVNYFNRNASSSSSSSILAQSYVTAVGAALVVAFGSSQLIQRRFDPKTASKLLSFVALPTCMIASSANAYIMRSPELVSGIALVDRNGDELVPGARSVTAARKAVWETVQSRVLMQLPVFFLPPLLLMFLAPSSPAMVLSTNVFLTLAFFGLGLPASVAVFPQLGELPLGDIDHAQVRQVASQMGLHTVFYNKGL